MSVLGHAAQPTDRDCTIKRLKRYRGPYVWVHAVMSRLEQIVVISCSRVSDRESGEQSEER